MRNVVGLFETRSEAENAIHRLKSGGVGLGSISVAMKDTHEAADLVETTGVEDMSLEGATAGLISGAAAGTLVGLALVGSTFIFPGVGTFVIGGPLAAALTGAGVGAASGGILGALIGSGIPEHEAGSYVEGIDLGHILVSAHVPDDLAPQAARILDEAGSRRTHGG